MREPFNLFFTLLFLSSITFAQEREYSNIKDTELKRLLNEEHENVYRYSESLYVDGIKREYTLNLPPFYYESQRFPLVIALHGAGGNAIQCEVNYRLTDKANAENYVIAYPEGVQSNGILGMRTWNAGYCCGYASENNVDDTHFISILIDTLVSRFNIDTKRIYIAGMSNGAMMAYRLACEIPKKIAAIAAVSGAMMMDTSCNPEKFVPILHIHSETDTKVPPQGGTGLAGYYFPSVDSILRVWAKTDSCINPEPIVLKHDEYVLFQWYNCVRDTSIEYYLTKDGGHSWPGSTKSRKKADTPSDAIDANEIIWDFFRSHEL